MSKDWGGVRELAAHYVQLISEEQRHGPYFIGGYSYGGLLAYEMASLLTEQNQRVEFVAMIDTFPWFPRSQTISTRLASMQENANSTRRHIQVRDVSSLSWGPSAICWHNRPHQISTLLDVSKLRPRSHYDRGIENCVFSLRKHQIFFIHTTPEKFENVTITGHFGLVFEWKSGREIPWLSWRHRL